MCRVDNKNECEDLINEFYEECKNSWPKVPDFAVDEEKKIIASRPTQ
jgi:hypothetical protein